MARAGEGRGQHDRPCRHADKMLLPVELDGETRGQAPGIERLANDSCHRRIAHPHAKACRLARIARQVQRGTV